MYKTLLVPVDLAHGDVGGRIVRLARSVGGPDAQVIALHVLDPVPSYVAAAAPDSILKAHREEALKDLEAQVHGIDPAARVLIRQGAPATMILEVAEDVKADAIVLGSHKPGLRDYLIGSTAARVVRHAPCSVIVDRGAAA